MFLVKEKNKQTNNELCNRVSLSSNQVKRDKWRLLEITHMVNFADITLCDFKYDRSIMASYDR